MADINSYHSSKEEYYQFIIVDGTSFCRCKEREPGQDDDCFIKTTTNSARNPYGRLDDSRDGYSIAVLQVIRQETQNDRRQQGQGAGRVTQGGHHILP